MEHFITQFGGWIGIAAAVIFGLFALIGLFNKNSKALKKEETDTATNVIDLLKEQVDALEGKVDQQHADIIELTKKVESLSSENETLTKVLQGRDGQTQAFYKDAYAGMEMVKAILKSTQENNTQITKLVTLMDGYIRAKT